MARKPIELPESFYEDWFITEVVRVVKSGKEATVYCCRAHPSQGTELLAAKVYRPRERRGFQNDAVYQEGRVILDKRVRRAFQNKTRFGREFQFSAWKENEFATLARLHAAGADVPRPYASDGPALLETYFGEESCAAPMLESVRLSHDQARREFDRVIANLEIFLSCNIVHGDLSGFNLLFWEEQVRIIDFPQAVDPRENRNAWMLFLRDVENVCACFEPYGIRHDPERLAHSLWQRFADDGLRRGSRREAELAEAVLAAIDAPVSTPRRSS